MDSNIPSDIFIKQEKLHRRDSNDNFQDILFDVKVKVEDAEVEEKCDSDWCIKSPETNNGDFLKPLYFIPAEEPYGYKCDLCSQYFTDCHSIYKHNLTHLSVVIKNPKTYHCDHCTAIFIAKKVLRKHISEKHDRQTEENHKRNKKKHSKVDIPDLKTKCKLDKKLEYTDKETDDTNVHITKSIQECKECGKTLAYKHWHAHMSEVHGEGGYKCECGIEFKCKRYLKRHLLYSGAHGQCKKNCKRDLQIQCDACDAVLRSAEALKTHKRTVHSLEKFVCEICKSQLKCQTYLFAHMRRVHYDDGKEHKCECGKKFRSPRYLMVHRRNTHLKKKK